MDGRMRRTTNLLPLAGGGVEARRGAVQVVPGDVTDLAVWGTRLVVERDGRIAVVLGRVVQDMGQAGRFVRGTAFQALVGGGVREDRFYVADGLNPLWYLARRGGQTIRESASNTILQPNGLPYPLDVPTLVTTWRGRVWIDEGPNRLRHCEFDRPDQWDPLWTVEFQAGAADRLHALLPVGEALLVGLRESMWLLTGKSQYDWQTSQRVAGRGCDGPQTVAGDGTTVYWVARDGLFQLGSAAPLSEDIRDFFGLPLVTGAVVLSPRGQRLFALVNGRVLVLHLGSGLWGELAATEVRGLFVLDGRVGWWGANGAWVLAADDAPDVDWYGRSTPVQAVLESWDQIQSTAGGGRALLNRVRFVLQGSPRGSATYTATVDGGSPFVADVSLADVSVDRWQDAVAPPDGSGEAWPTPPVFRELVPRLAGRAFRHRLDCAVYFRLDKFVPEFRQGAS
jgi:hypothetical protein